MGTQRISAIAAAGARRSAALGLARFAGLCRHSLATLTLLLPKSSTKRCPPGHQAVTTSLRAKIEAMAISRQADFERERDRADKLAVEVLKVTAEAITGKEAKARLEGESAALRSRPW